MAVGQNVTRVDAFEKVTGRAKYTADLCPQNAYVAKVIRSSIANGVVKSFDLTEAEKVPGVVKILTCFDVPEYLFPTAGHPWTLIEAKQDVADRLLLNRRVRIHGDDIGVVIAEDEIAADRALRAVKVEYEIFAPIVTPEQAVEAEPLHKTSPDNVLAKSNFKIGEGDFDEETKREGVRVRGGTYHTQTVQHCHIETAVSYAYMEGERVVVVSSTQIPHIVRRVIGQALGMPWGKVRVIKPYIGGGFGNKQEVLYEPLCAFLTTKVGGRPVRIELSREEVFFATRVRHAMDFELSAVVSPEGKLIARKFRAVSHQGGYASHGHSIVANASNGYRHLYQDDVVLEAEALTVYTNIASGGAMRGYGIPQLNFAMESHMDDIALEIGMDPIDFRLKNCMKQGYVDPGTGIACYSTGLEACVEKGRTFIDWDARRKAYQGQTGPVRRGVGMAMFSYKTGVYPISLETASCRMVLNQDGTIQLQMGATEIGQGADTVFSQMAAQTLGIPVASVHIVSAQDTDVTPFDTGAYASRQTYVSGMALKKTGEALRAKILAFAGEKFSLGAEALDIRDGAIVRSGGAEVLCSLAALAEEAFYDLDRAGHITAEETVNCKLNTFSFGACFAHVEVDISLGKVNILDIINVHDSGKLINPKLAEAQVHGGMSMGIGYALSEELLYDDEAYPLNSNLLDYKLPTSLDTPELSVDFVETDDPSGPYGNKSLGEPPAIPPGAAIRNAVLNATGVGVNALPLHPQRLVKAFTDAGLI
ncbi:xanthine dehydrogenase molybdenum-binding subunit XdhA [Oscillospiraceae bacterium OttesenSCG-928-F05]|nr:xanthine dehydrogenase molybdenum-binding subunit XdhA [Oscillospiraceae bacterium OttesenSCG-928-F05]